MRHNFTHSKQYNTVEYIIWKKSIYNILENSRSGPAIDNFGTPFFNPTKTLLYGSLNLSFNSVNLITSHSLLPLQLWIIETPALRNWPITGLTFLKLHFLGQLHLSVIRCIGSTITSKPIWVGVWTGFAVTVTKITRIAVPFDLSSGIVIWLVSQVIHGWIFEFILWIWGLWFWFTFGFSPFPLCRWS